jgi:hypothetical protein
MNGFDDFDAEVTAEEFYSDEVEYDDPMSFEDFEDSYSDVEADADTLASAGYGTDEDYGYFGGDEW